MNSRGENNLSKNPESILVLLIFLITLLTVSNIGRTVNKAGCSPSISSSLNRSDALPSSGLPALFCGKSPITSPVDMKLLNLRKDPEFENRVSDLKINISRNIRMEICQSPPFTFICHLLPVENDDLSVLG